MSGGRWLANILAAISAVAPFSCLAQSTEPSEELTMSPRYGINDLDWADVGQLNQEGYVDDPTLEDNPVVFDDQFEQRSRELQHTPPASSATSIIPSKKGPWSGNNQLGIEQAYQPDGNGYQTILKMDEWDFPKLWTISLGIAYNPALISGGGNAQFSIDGLIQFGSGGVTQEFEVDWAEGTTFSIPMNAINVIARYSDFTSKNNTPSDLVLRVNLSQGGSPQGIPPTRSFLLDVANAAFEVVLIPKFARRLRVQRGFGDVGGAWDANVFYNFRGTGTGLAGDLGGFTGAEYLANFAASGVPIPASARSVRITNISGGSVTLWTIFDIGF